MEVYDAKKDEEFSKGYIDVDEMRVRVLDDGTEIPFRYMHGGFEGTDVKFSFCFPEKDRYEGRFYQYLSPFPGPEEELASLPVTGIDDTVAFCLTHGAYYVESNMGSKAIFSNSDDRTMTHRSSAASAEFSRVKAQEVYGYEHRPYGYVYGGSGGGYRTIACIENTNAFDGAIPFVIGSPYAIPNCQTTRAHAERLLRNKMPQIIDAVDVGGSGDPYQGLNEEEAAALREATMFGYPMKSWFASAGLNDGSLPVLLPGIKAMDPDYFEDFWKVEGYLGADPTGSAARERICMDTKVKRTCISIFSERVMAEQAEALAEAEENSDVSSELDHSRASAAQDSSIDTRNGVDDAWKKMITGLDGNGEPWLEVEAAPQGEDLYLKGAVLEFTDGDAKGKKMQIGRIEGNRIYIGEGYGMDSAEETLRLVKVGDGVHLDNSDYIAVQTYHRHQVPSRDYLAWDQFRDENGNSLYPQQKNLIGPIFCGNGPGCEQNGLINGKIIIVAALMDEQAYPWQADWYRRKVASVHDGDESEYCRLWYFDNALHGNITATMQELYVTSYVAGLRQALVDLAAWVEKGIEPLPSSNYTVDIGRVSVPETAAERGGIQPVPVLTAAPSKRAAFLSMDGVSCRRAQRGGASMNGSKCAHVKAGEAVQFHVDAEVPEGAGALTFVEWSFEGEQDFPEKGEFALTDDGRKGTAEAVHTYQTPGTYFGVVRVMSERNGDKSAIFTQVRNIDRVRVIVEE